MHDALMREAGHPAYLTPFDRAAPAAAAGSLMRRSGEDGLIHKTTWNAPAAPAPTATAAVDDVRPPETFAEVCADIGLSELAMNTICAMVGMSAGELRQEIAELKREVAELKEIDRLKTQIAELERERNKSAAVIDLPAIPLRSRRHVA
jgi:hypothetical protein